MKRLACYAAFLLLMLPAIVNAQNVILTGNVKSASGGESLGAVSITLKGNSNGTFTDNKGNFRLSLPSNTKFPVSILFSSIGYAITEVRVAAAGEMKSVSLNPTSTLGEEVVV